MADHPDHIHTHHDTIPHFCADENVWSVRSGLWSDPGTWNVGRVPEANDIACILNANRVDLDMLDAIVGGICMEDGGVLNVLSDRNTSLRFVNMMVLHGGELRAEIIDPAFKSEFIFRDTPLNTVLDPKQWGNALLVIEGLIKLKGAQKTTYLRTALEPKIGHNTLVFQTAPVGWRPGDVLYVPDTRVGRNNTAIVDMGEVRIVDHVDGVNVFVTAPLTYDHLGVRADGVLRYTPHVMNLTRNLILRSENPAGTRGHVAIMGRSDASIDYVEHKELGRTKALTILNNTKTDSAGITTIGTNQVGRYMLHAHHLIGPAGLPDNVPQFRFGGNALNGSPKWGIVLHNSHHGLVEDNVMYRCLGAGLMGETGAETRNVINRNMAAACWGSNAAIYIRLNKVNDFSDDIGHEGSGFWFKGSGQNIITDNVATNAFADGFTFGNLDVGDLKVPLFKGADPDVEGEYEIINAQRTPVLQFKGNEVYGMLHCGLNAFEIGRDAPDDQAPSLFENLIAWNVPDAVDPRGNAMTFKDTIVLGDGGKFVGSAFSVKPGRLARNIKIVNAEIKGMSYAVEVPAMTDYLIEGQPPQPAAQPFTIEGGDFKNNKLADVFVPMIQIIVAGFQASPEQLPARRVLIQNAGLGSAKTIVTAAPLSVGPNLRVNYVQNDEIIVEAYRADPAANFRIYFKEQAPNFIVPQSIAGKVLGSPVAGLTNTQCLAAHGVCIGGAIAPNTDTLAHPEIVGFVEPIEIGEDMAQIAQLKAQIAQLQQETAALQTQVNARTAERDAANASLQAANAKLAAARVSAQAVVSALA